MEALQEALETIEIINFLKDQYLDTDNVLFAKAHNRLLKKDNETKEHYILTFMKYKNVEGINEEDAFDDIENRLIEIKSEFKKKNTGGGTFQDFSLAIHERLINRDVKICVGSLFLNPLTGLVDILSIFEFDYKDNNFQNSFYFTPRVRKGKSPMSYYKRLKLEKTIRHATFTHTAYEDCKSLKLKYLNKDCSWAINSLTPGFRKLIEKLA